jgi:ribosomal protein L44E
MTKYATVYIEEVVCDKCGAHAVLENVDVARVKVPMSTYVERRKQSRFVAEPAVLQRYRYRLRCVDCGYSITFEEQD